MASTPRFFKIILDRTIRDEKLGIPKKFVRLYGKHLSSHVVLLKVCNGESWKIELNKCDDEIWLQNGWQEFADRYGLAHGHLLVFEFHRKITSQYFNVLIFDKSATEIDYPFIQIVNLDNETDLEEEFQEPTEIIVRKQRLYAKEKRGALKKASETFKSKHPFFMSVMQPSYVHSEDKITIPASFARKNFNKKNGNAILRIMDGKRWPVKLYIPNFGSNRKATAKICQGWRVFGEDNQLEVGDVCAFELIKGAEITFLVSFFKNCEHCS
ncbi:B3 domain-containing transcription factor VRN1-like [Mercurialis annua]|uniref:B3 domain-containing transcription factor VRN1-like n=1 Tax=Mercurialis annua TaxID=3986 RepID=UPI00215EB55A|nr:B3 domain-containing transcription factor VRN1-like [Mercurialis annua]